MFHTEAAHAEVGSLFLHSLLHYPTASMALRSHIALAIVIAVLLVSLVTANLRMTEDGKEDSLSLYWDAMDANGDGHVTIPEMESLFTKLYGHGVSIGQVRDQTTALCFASSFVAHEVFILR